MVSGLGYALAQPGWGYWPLAAVCLVPLLRACVGRGAMARAALGWAAGTAATCAATAVPAAVGSTAYFGLSLWQGVVIALSVGQVFGAGSFALAAALAGDPSKGRASVALVRLGAAWAGAEFARSTGLTGLPWMLLAHALAPVPDLIQAASVGGTLLVSAWLAALNGALLLCASSGRRRGGALAVASISLGVAASLLLGGPPDGSSANPGNAGRISLASGDREHRKGWLRVLLVQGSLPNAWRGEVARIGDALDRMMRLSETPDPVDLVVWPENAVSFLLPENESRIADAIRVRRRFPPYLLFGTPRLAGRSTPILYNSAALLGPDRHTIGFHDKVHRLPFAEYVPWPFERFARPGLVVTAGDRPVVLAAGAVPIGPLICFEIVFSQLARDLVRDGAEVLVNISNDAWFGSTGAIEQHFASAVFRAVETRRPVLRATNTGITAAIDSAGRVVGRLDPDRTGTLEVSVMPGTGLTPYMRSGEVLGPIALAGAALLLAAEIAMGRRDRR